MNTIIKVILVFLLVMVLGFLGYGIANAQTIPNGQTTQIPGARTIKVGTVYWAIDTAQVKTVFEVWDSSIQCPIVYIHDTIYLNATQTSIYTTQTLPTTSATDGKAITLGVQFQSSVAGYIKAIRFYKTSANTGTHTGTLYSSSGSVLFTGTFQNETATGWQLLPFSIPIQANTTYTAAYYSPTGKYSSTLNQFANSIVNGSLKGLKGVYVYGTGLPTSSYSNSGYWIDIVLSNVP